MAKYKLTKEYKIWCGIKLYQIEATESFGNVSKGDKGGYIEKEANLSVYGNAWVSGDARVSGNVCVYGNARVSGNACVYGNAWVSGDARVSGNACVYGNARVSGNAWVSGNACVYGKLKLTLGYFFGYKNKDEDLKYFDLGDGYELIGKGDCKAEEENTHKTELLKKADELIEKANQLKEEANKLE